MANSYKALKEDFVSNLTGGEILEINYVTAIAPAAVVLWSVLQSRQSFFSPYGPAASAADFLINCGAILLATTLYSSAPLLLNALTISPALLLYFLPAATPRYKKAKPPIRKFPTDSSVQSPGFEHGKDPLPIRPFLTTYRGAMMIVTCIAILAVDFKVFPRRFAKVENWGTSLMDLGVGSFVFSAGLVSARSLFKESLTPRLAALHRRLLRSARHSLPLLVLGLVRLYSVKGLDYAEHVTEYGVHWNFFFTLAFIPPFVALFQSAFQIIPSYAILSILLGATYQAGLEFTDLKAYILTAPRTDLLSKNREGVFSFFGYLAIFLAGQATGMYVLPRDIKPDKKRSDGGEQRKALLLTLAGWSAIWTFLFMFTTQYKYGLGLQVSRRLANLPYFLWVTAFNCCQLTLFCLIETFFFPSVYTAVDKTTENEKCDEATSKVLHAYNRNGLAIFLLANLLTGLVNLTLPTLHMGRLQAMGVLVAYAATLTGVAVTLDVYNISVKL
ncbi:MAG: Glucosaminyl phosphatidylinositol (GlcN-PI) nositol acylation protein [Pycnora praestabilis]|nr:MAG: Glucosaminyl phosphatidylinositol (GlcN-PI) nositol acylation protein [Pycnora praestabilis]